LDVYCCKRIFLYQPTPETFEYTFIHDPLTVKAVPEEEEGYSIYTLEVPKIQK
jgi:hypothetical protein